ncbi:MAG TPA: chitobiase/beta-hexosaminidase C-terminal domain-containing protein, partial [Roseimicrobium sp.]|nr:chitobiase/beta-hexosaminidase C-terminal domain-containing protein [Roseimicrobium sp.]
TGSLGSQAFGVGGGQQAGFGQFGQTVGDYRALLWTGTAGSVVNLHPAAGGYSIAFGADAGQQAGYVTIGGQLHASLWSGTAASWVDLHPAGTGNSRALGISGGQQVGNTWVGYYQAALWSGSAGSYVNLNPPPTNGYTHSSEAWGVGDGSQVGYVVATGGIPSASLWSGSAGSWVNLHPAGAEESYAFGVSGGQQAGYIVDREASPRIRASLWTGSAASWVDLHPAGTSESSAFGVHGGQQVGRVYTGGAYHAGLWSGTAGSFVDLHSSLPGSWASSEALGIKHEGGYTYIVGFGLNGATGRYEAVLWVNRIATPTFNPAPGTYSTTKSVTLSTTTPSATIRYTTNGTTPTEASAAYSGAISVTQTTTIKARAYRAGWSPSAVASGTYILKAVAPTFSPVPGTYLATVNVTISSGTSGSTIHYTTDGTVPTEASPTYAGPVSIDATTVLKAKTFKTGWSASAVTSGTYKLAVTTPTFNPAAGTYAGFVDVTITTSTPGTTIYYTLDGTTPTNASIMYSGPVHIAATSQLKARAYRSGWTASPVKGGTYKITP